MKVLGPSTNASAASLADADIAAARGFEPAYDVERGAARLATALAAGCAAGAISADASAATLAKGATVPNGLTQGIAAKAIGFFAVTGAVVATELAAPPVEDSAACVAPLAQSSPVLDAPRAPEPKTASSVATAHPAVTVAAAPAPLASQRGATGSPRNTNADDAAFARDLARVAEARELLGHDPASALAKAGDDMTASKLAEEREIIAIRALVALDRMPEARERARDFAARRPDSPFAPSARSLAAGQDR